MGVRSLYLHRSARGRYFQFAQRRSGHRSCLLLKSGKCPHWEVLPTFVARLVE